MFSPQNSTNPRKNCLKIRGENPAVKTAGKIGGKKFYIYLANGKNLTFFAYFFELASYRGTTMSELGNSSVRSESGGSKASAKTAGKIGGKKFYIYLANGKNLTFFAYFFELASYRGTTMSELGNSSVRSESGGS